MKATLIFLVLFTLSLPTALAQDYTRWNLPEGATARVGKGSIHELKYSPDGTRLAVASSIGIWLYDTRTHEEAALLTGHTGEVNSVAFSPDGGTLASASDDYTVRLWDAVTGGAPANAVGAHEGSVKRGVQPGWRNAGKWKSRQFCEVVGRRGGRAPASASDCIWIRSGAWRLARMAETLQAEAETRRCGYGTRSRETH